MNDDDIKKMSVEELSAFLKEGVHLMSLRLEQGAATQEDRDGMREIASSISDFHKEMIANHEELLAKALLENDEKMAEFHMESINELSRKISQL